MLLLCALLGLCSLVLPRTVAAQQAASPPLQARPTALSFALIGDPQIGYGSGGDFSDRARFAEVVQAVNASDVQLALIVGDLVQDRSLLQRRLFQGVFSTLRPKTLLVAGNHDVVDTASLARYRQDNGPDYYDYVQGDTAFVVLDSETARNAEISAGEHAAQWAFIESTLRAHALAKRKHLFLALHRPPFVDDENEADSDGNWPASTRHRLLALARETGVRWILAGHLHVRHEVSTADGIQIVVGPGSARNFDASPVGYHHFVVEGPLVKNQWQVVAPPPPPPWHVPGFRGWTPRLVDFSPRHWCFTLLYSLAAVFCVRTGRALRGRRAGEPRAWQGIALALFFFAANMQLDLDEFVQEVGRFSVKLVGIDAIRHVVSATLLSIGVVLAGLWLAGTLRTGRRSRALLAALSALGVPSLWFALSMISHHDIGMILSEDTWDVLILSCLATIAGSAALASRKTKVGHA